MNRGDVTGRIWLLAQVQSNMNSLLKWSPLVGPGLAALIAIIGWLISHWLSSKRELKNEKRKIRINFMIESYRKLENGSSRGTAQNSYSDNLQSALADIQLLGSPNQAGIARDIARSLGDGSGKIVTINKLLLALRSELRSELNLPPISDQLIILRDPGEIPPQHRI